MAHRRASIKKIRVDERRRERNRRVITELRTAFRKVSEFIIAKKGDEARKASHLFFSKLDQAAKKGIIHSKNASRRKSRTQLKINAL